MRAAVNARAARVRTNKMLRLTVLVLLGSVVSTASGARANFLIIEVRGSGGNCSHEQQAGVDTAF